MSYSPSDEIQDIDKQNNCRQELNPCNLRLNSSVQRSPLCTSSISTHRTELVLNLTCKSLQDSLLERKQSNSKESTSLQPPSLVKLSHPSDLSSLKQPISKQQLAEKTIISKRQIENLCESVNYPYFNQQPVAYESHQTKTSHAALNLRPVIPETIYQSTSTQLTYHSQNSHPFRRRGSIHFSSTFPIRNESDILLGNIHNSAGTLTIPSGSQVTYCIPFNSTPGTRFSVSFTGNSSRHPGSSGSSLTIIQSSPSHQTEEATSTSSTSHTQVFVDSQKTNPSKSGQLFTHHQGQQISFGAGGGQVTSVIIPFHPSDSSTMNRQISAPSSNDRRPSDSNLRVPGRSASVSPTSSPIPPPRPSVPNPAYRRMTPSASSNSLHDDYLRGKF